MLKDTINEFLEEVVQWYRHHIKGVDETAPESKFIKVGKDCYMQKKTGRYCYKGYGGPWGHDGMIDCKTHVLIYSELTERLNKENEERKQHCIERGWYSYAEHVVSGLSGKFFSYYYIHDLRKKEGEEGYDFGLYYRSDLYEPYKFIYVLDIYNPNSREVEIDFETFLKLALPFENDPVYRHSNKYMPWIFFNEYEFKRMLFERAVIKDPKHDDNYLITDIDRCNEILKEGSFKQYEWLCNVQKSIPKPYPNRIRQTS